MADLQYYLNHSRPLFIDTAYKNKADFVIDDFFATDKQVYWIQQREECGGVVFLVAWFYNKIHNKK